MYKNCVNLTTLRYITVLPSLLSRSSVAPRSFTNSARISTIAVGVSELRVDRGRVRVLMRHLGLPKLTVKATLSPLHEAVVVLSIVELTPVVYVHCDVERSRMRITFITNNFITGMNVANQTKNIFRSLWSWHPSNRCISILSPKTTLKAIIESTGSP